MPRPMLPQSRLSPDAESAMAAFHNKSVQEVQLAVEKDPVVIVGMSGNVFVTKARKALKQAGIEYTYLEYGSYVSQWKQRLAIKLWSGWPTFPQVFVRGVLIGGANDLIRGLQNGSVKTTAKQK